MMFVLTGLGVMISQHKGKAQKIRVTIDFARLSFLMGISLHRHCGRTNSETRQSKVTRNVGRECGLWHAT